MNRLLCFKPQILNFYIRTTPNGPAKTSPITVSNFFLYIQPLIRFAYIADNTARVIVSDFIENFAISYLYRKCVQKDG